MANKYWVKNQISASAVSADVDANWKDAVDGSGSTGKPGASDIAIIGHPTTVANNKGFANISWDITNVGGLVIYDGYTYDLSTTKTTISFTGGGTNTISITTGTKWDDIGFKVGMWITVAGSTSNNGSTYITAISNNVMTVNKTLTTEAAGDTVTVSTSMSLDVAANFECDYISLNGTMKNSSGSMKTITLDGNFQSGSNNRYVLNGATAQILNQDIITYKYNGNSGSQPAAISPSSDRTIYFDDGPYPNVQIYPALDLSCDYHAAPTSNAHGEVSMYSFTVTNASSTMNPTTENAKNDTSKSFKLLTTGFTYAPEIIDVGLSKWIFKISSATWIFPVTGSASYGAADGTFKAYWYNIQLETGTAGYVATLEGGRTLSVNALTIEGDAVLRGHADKDDPSSVIVSVSRPNIKGAWNFSQVADGVYASIISKAYPITPSEGAGGMVQLSDNGGKFSFDPQLYFDKTNNILWSDKGLKITDGLDHPLTPATGFGQIWVKSSDNKLYFTDEGGTDYDLTASGGGGGSMSSFTLAGSSGSSQSITDGNTLTIAQGTGITSVASATDTVTITNTGVTSNVAGAGIGVSGATGAVTVSNTGVTSNVAGANIAVSGATGAVTVSAPFPEQPAGGIPAFSVVPDEVGKVPFGWINIVTVSGQSVWVPAWVAI